MVLENKIWKLPGGILLSVLLASTLGTAAADEAETAADSHVVTITEGTNIALTASEPDGSVIMDLQGFLFRVPLAGGTAERLTGVEMEAARPHYSPDGSRVVFQSFNSGVFHAWVMDSDGENVRQVTEGPYDVREPRWSPDGETIAFSSDRNGAYDIWTVDADGGEWHQWTAEAGQQFEPTWSPDGTEIAYVSGSDIKAVDADGNTRTLVEGRPGESFNSPAWGPDGESVAYVRDAGATSDLMVSGRQVTEGEDVFAFTPHWLSADELLYAADGAVRAVDVSSGDIRDIPFSATLELPRLDYEKKSRDFDRRAPMDSKGILTPSLSPDAKSVAFVALNDVWVMPVGKQPRRVTDDRHYESEPDWSPDGRFLAYASDRSGTPDIYVRDMDTGDERQLTDTDGAAVAPRWSPDGEQLAYQDQSGATYVVDRDGANARQLTGNMTSPGRPSWSPDGETIALAVLRQYSNRFFAEGGRNQILTVDVATGEQTVHPVGLDDEESVATRGDDGPVWSPDGRWMAAVVDSTLQVIPVDEDGAPTGPPRQVTDEASDAPSWSGDSEWLLYLNNGNLRMVSRDGSETREVPTRLRFRRDHPVRRTVIHAGRFWDGTSPEVQEDVDIIVIGNRIRRVMPHRGPLRGPHVDASDLTVMPGLWDSHVHQNIQARFFGNRQGRINLSYGITSTVSTGDMVYRAIEDREALASGDRVGPRYFATGEMLDGRRLLWNFSRSVTNSEQLQLELDRARELDYDYLKTYMRLPATLMAEVAQAAHDMGVPTGSHYMAPGAFVGQDGTTHLSGPHALGYARTRSSTGESYDDVLDVYGTGQRSLQTTLTIFDHDFVMEDEVVGDPRVQLYPPWVRQRLLATVEGNVEPPTDDDCQTSKCKSVQTFQEIQQRGGTIIAGTDAPLAFFGTSLHADLRTLVAYGYSPYEALLTATKDPAEHIGAGDDLGTLETGKLADMVFVDGNPLERVDDAMKVQMVMKNGKLMTIDDLVEPYAEGEASS